MMKTAYQICLILLIVGMGVSCKSNKLSLSTTKDKYGLVVDKKWEKYLIESKTVVKKTVNDFQQYFIGMFDEKDVPAYYYIDVNKYEAIPVDVYLIDSLTYSALDENTDYKTILKPYKEAAKYYFLEHGEFVKSATMGFENGKWVRIDGGPSFFDKTYAKKLTEIIFEKKLRYMSILVKASKFTRFFNAFIDENGKFMIINESGRVWPIGDVLIGF